jgi:hypothetical protein
MPIERLSLPALLEAEPLQEHFQVEPGNEILEGFHLKLTPMKVAASRHYTY